MTDTERQLEGGCACGTVRYHLTSPAEARRRLHALSVELMGLSAPAVSER